MNPDEVEESDNVRHLREVKSSGTNSSPQGSISKKERLQWGSEIHTSLDYKWLKKGWVVNGPDFEWDLKSGSSTIPNLDKWQPFFQKPVEIRTKMYGF